uniref:C2H2-type domain-containing protein n=1 Tax=Glossina palpalis gambiensis TaxID=67801 RepID=A0A1B0C0G4_9MUSC
MPRRKRSLHYNLNTMALHYQQLRRFCKKLQKKCQNLEQNVEQLQSQPTIKSLKNFSKIRNTVNASLQSIKCSQAKNLNKKQYQNEFLKFECLVCSKNFSNGNSLRQHKITHTEERKHTCGLCHRAFKRRNGLLQHLKGFHLQVKPFTCPVCAHSYALKCDMQRCKHSLLKVTQNQDGSNNNNNLPAETLI